MAKPISQLLMEEENNPKRQAIKVDARMQKLEEENKILKLKHANGLQKAAHGVLIILAALIGPAIYIGASYVASGSWELGLQFAGATSLLGFVGYVVYTAKLRTFDEELA